MESNIKYNGKKHCIKSKVKKRFLSLLLYPSSLRCFEWRSGIVQSCTQKELLLGCRKVGLARKMQPESTFMLP